MLLFYIKNEEIAFRRLVGHSGTTSRSSNLSPSRSPSTLWSIGERSFQPCSPQQPITPNNTKEKSLFTGCLFLSVRDGRSTRKNRRTNIKTCAFIVWVLARLRVKFIVTVRFFGVVKLSGCVAGCVWWL